MTDAARIFLRKAEESLAGAVSEFANGRYNNCANRCYYSCFQAAVAAIIQAGMRPQGKHPWGHTYVQGQFVGQLINRRKVYPAELRDVLARAFTLREAADYQLKVVTHDQAKRLLARTHAFVHAVKKGGNTQ